MAEQVRPVYAPATIPRTLSVVMSAIHPAGQVITFYSYKGGTGRSMALANIACLLARQSGQGRGVLVIDWDLEARACTAFSNRI